MNTHFHMKHKLLLDLGVLLTQNFHYIELNLEMLSFFVMLQFTIWRIGIQKKLRKKDRLFYSGLDRGNSEALKGD